MDALSGEGGHYAIKGSGRRSPDPRPPGPRARPALPPPPAAPAISPDRRVSSLPHGWSPGVVTRRPRLRCETAIGGKTPHAPPYLGQPQRFENQKAHDQRPERRWCAPAKTEPSVAAYRQPSHHQLEELGHHGHEDRAQDGARIEPMPPTMMAAREDRHDQREALGRDHAEEIRPQAAGPRRHRTTTGRTTAACSATGRCPALRPRYRDRVSR